MARTPNKGLVEDLEPWRKVADEEADTYAEALYDRYGGNEPPNLMRDLGRWDPGSGAAPADAREYLQRQPGPLPGWADRDRLARAQAAYTARRGRARIVLATYSLPIVYLHAETSLTLAATGQLVMHVRRRLFDTLAFTEAVMNPGSFDAGGLGMAWVRKIRLTHALARSKVKRLRAKTLVTSAFETLSPAERVLATVDSGPIKDEVPLDQAELAFVLQSFAWVLVEGLDALGKPMTREESSDYLHGWSLIGHWLGINDALLPKTTPDAQALFVQIRDDLLRAGDPFAADPKDRNDTRQAGRLLTAALATTLVQVLRERVPPDYAKWLVRLPMLDEALQQMPRVLIRRLCGLRCARHLRVTRPPLLHALICCVAWVLLGERVDRLTDADLPGGHSGGGPTTLDALLWW